MNDVTCPTCSRTVLEINLREDEGDCLFCGLGTGAEA